MILAAGLGSRLGVLTDERPKPLLPICDVPVIRYAIALLAGHGIRELIVNLHHLGELIEAELGSGADQGVRIRYSREAPHILGTGGGMKHALAQGLLDADQPFVAVNGKIVFDLDLGAVLAQHHESRALATLVVRADPEARRWGAIGVRDGRVVSILPAAAEPGVSEHMFTGVQVIEPALLRRLPDGEACILRQGYIPALAAGEHLAAYVAPGYFQEHSTPARYLEGNLNLLGGRVTLPYAPGPLTGVNPTATIAGARIVEPVRNRSGRAARRGRHGRPRRRGRARGARRSGGAPAPHRGLVGSARRGQSRRRHRDPADRRQGIAPPKMESPPAP